MKITNTPVTARNNNTAFQVFCETLAKLRVGQSFTMPELSGNYRVGISAIQYVMNRRFATTTSESNVRIGRIA